MKKRRLTNVQLQLLRLRRIVTPQQMKARMLRKRKKTPINEQADLRQIEKIKGEKNE